MKRLSKAKKEEILLQKFRDACRCDDLNLVKTILKQHPDINTKFDQFCGFFSTQKDKIEVVKYYLQEIKIDPSRNDNRLIRLSVIGDGNVDLFRMLIKDERVDISTKEDEFLFSSLRYGNFEIARELLKHLKKPINRDLVTYFCTFHAPKDILKTMKELIEGEEKESELKKIKI